MSESPFPYDQPAYQSYQTQGGAPALVKVAAILNLVVAALELIFGLFFLTFSILTGTGTIPESVFREGAAGGPMGPGGTPPPLAFFIVIMVVMGILPLFTAILKTIAGIKLLKRSNGAWGWGLAAGIVGCVQLWCIYGCALSLALGIFTIVVMSLESTRRYLAAPVPAA